LAIGFSGDDRLNPSCFEDVTKRIGVISFIGDKLSDSGDQAHAGFGHNAVGRVARRRYKYPWTALIIDNRMDLAIPAAFGEAYRLRFPPPFSAADAAVDFHMTAVECHLLRCIMLTGDRSHEILPDAPLAPACKTIVDRLMRPVLTRTIFPATA